MGRLLAYALTHCGIKPRCLSDCLGTALMFKGDVESISDVKYIADTDPDTRIVLMKVSCIVHSTLSSKTRCYFY